MKRLLLCFALMAGPASAQQVPAGTILPVQVNQSINSAKATYGQEVTARVMQDVPLPSGKRVPRGATVLGHIVKTESQQQYSAAVVTLRFDTLRIHKQSIPLKTNLRALAGMMEVHQAQVPTMSSDRGTPWAWLPRNLIGGEVAYGQGGPVSNGRQRVGEVVGNGVLVRVQPNPRRGCRGEIGDSAEPQALWVFSSDACGVYGDSFRIADAGRSSGDITLSSDRGYVKLQSGSGLLLRVN